MKKLILISIGVFVFLLNGVQAQTARTGRFSRGYSPAITGSSAYAKQSFVVPLDFQKGVAYDALNGNGKIFYPNNNWSTLNHIGESVLSFNNPVAAFGSRVGGTPLYSNRTWSFAIGAGVRGTRNDTSPNAGTLRIRVYDRNTFASVGTTEIRIPQRGTPEWDSLVQNNLTVSVNQFGLKTDVKISLKTNLSDPTKRNWVETANWGAPEAYLLTHTSSNTTYVYVVEGIGYVEGTSQPFVTTSGGAESWSRLYTLEFDAPLAWTSTFIDQPQFEGKPLPPAYQGKTVAELLAAPVTIPPVPSVVPSNYLQIDQSPELRRHPDLDQFVANMGNDPIALANYVINEVRNTDMMDYRDDKNVADPSINIGGFKRGALATFYEGQGNPLEQCALLVYLLRQAGVPAAYVTTTQNQLKVLDVTLSHLLHTQLKNAKNSNGEDANLPQTFNVNYPWVAAYVGGQWIHIFPWLKDAEIKEGLDLYSQLPEAYNSGFKFAQKFLQNDPAILGLSTESDQPDVLFPKLIEKSLQDNHSDASLEKIGMQIVNRKHLYSNWPDFPKPFQVGGTLAFTESFNATPNIFNTIEVKIKPDKSGGTTILTTGVLRMVDVLERRLTIRFEKTGTNQHRMHLSLSPFSSLVTQASTQAASFNLSADRSWRLNAYCDVDPVDYLFKVTVTRTMPRYGSSGPSLSDLSNRYLEFHNYTPFSYPIFKSFYKGSFMALVLNEGRVTPRMYLPHAQTYWAMEKQKEADPQFSPDPETYIGTAAHLMGLQYWDQDGRFGEMNSRLHKVSVMERTGALWSLLKPRTDSQGNLPNSGDVIPEVPALDVDLRIGKYVYNGSLHSDSGKDPRSAQRDFYIMDLLQGSAGEHQAINSFFRMKSSVSTVKLLQLAGPSKTVSLTKGNYVAQGNTLYPSGGSTLLKDYDPNLWSSVNSYFTSAGLANPIVFDERLVWMTSEPMTNADSSFRGMGAFMIDDHGGSSALLGADLLNGGSGGPVFGGEGMTGGTVGSWKLTVDVKYSYHVSYTEYTMNFQTSSLVEPGLAPIATADNWNNFASQIGNNLAVTGFQSSQYVPEIQGLANITPTGNTVTDFKNATQFNLDKGTVGKPNFFKQAMGFLADPVYVVNGNFHMDEVDLQLNGPVPLQVRRNYSSREAVESAMGFGWKPSEMHFLSVNQTGDVIYAAEMDGSVIAYRTSQSNVWVPTVADNPLWINQTTSGVGSISNLLHSRIERPGGGNTYLLKSVDGSVRTYNVRSYPVDGINRQRPYLDTWKDSRGNTLTFTYQNDPAQPGYGYPSKVSSSNGSFVLYSYDVLNRITQVYAGDGRSVQYTYDSLGDLVEVTRPDLSVVRYEYEHLTQMVNGSSETYSTHLMLREVKPDGRKLENTYDSNRRVIEQRATVGTDLTPVRNATFTYFNTEVTPGVFTGYTTVSDAYNRVSRFDYAGNLITNITDPLNQTTHIDWYLPGDNSPGAYPQSVKKMTDSRGLITEYTYDANGNVVLIKDTGDLTGNGVLTETTTRSFLYDSATQLLTQSKDDSTGNFTKVYHESAAYPYSPTRVETYTSSGMVSQRKLDYHDVISGGKSSYGLLQRVTEAVGTADESVVEWTHDSRGCPTQQTLYSGTTDPNVVINFTCNNRSEVIEELDSLGRKTGYAYDDMGRRIWTERRDETGKLVAWHYDYFNQNGEVEWSDGSRYNPEDYTWQKYDGAGRPSERMQWRSQAKADGSGVEEAPGYELYSTTFYKHNLFGDLIEIHDPRKSRIEMSYDGIGQLTERRFYQGDTATLLSKDDFTYEPGGEVQTYTNPLGGVTTKLYNSRGQIREQQNPDGTIQKWRYNLDGRLNKAILTNGAYQEVTYDDFNRKITSTFKSSTGTVQNSTIKEFDRRSNCTKFTDELGKATTYTYDDLNRVKTSTGPASPGAAQVKLTYTYDAAGKTLIVKNNTSETTTTTFDALGRPTLVQIKNSGGTLIQQSAYAYSDDHQSVTTTTGTGSAAISSTSWTDTFGQPVLTRYADGKFIRNAYDVSGNLLSSQDELGKVTQYTYDSLNRVASTVEPDTTTTTFLYNAAGELLQRQMPAGLTQTMTYDIAGRKLTEQLNNGSTVSRKYKYTYFGTGTYKGLLQKVIDPISITNTYAYDTLLRVKSVTGTPATQPAVTTAYTYDKRSMVTLVSQSYADGSVAPTAVARKYNGNGQCTNETVSVNGVKVREFNQVWDKAGRRTQLTDPTATTLPSPTYAFTWQADGNLTKTTVDSKAYNFTYRNNGLFSSASNPYFVSSIPTTGGRDVRGRILSMTTTAGGQNFVEGMNWRDDSLLNAYGAVRPGFFDDTRNYGYDTRNRITSESLSWTPGQTTGITYGFDANGWSVRTLAKVNAGKPDDYQIASTAVNNLGRTTTEVSNGLKKTVPINGNAAGANSVRTFANGLELKPVTFTGPSGNGDWSANASLVAGKHVVSAMATFPSGPPVTGTSDFTVSQTTDTTHASVYNARGDQTTRKLADGSTQTLTWDGLGRLIKIVQRNGSNNGFDWTAIYDGLGRRIQTTHIPVVANVQQTSTSVQTDSWYDPEVEFLEVAVKVSGPSLTAQRYFKVFGPDMDHGYGGLQGTGGLQAVIRESDKKTEGVLHNSFGDVVAAVDGGVINWSPYQLTGYGALPHTPVQSLEEYSVDPRSADIEHLFCWKTRRIDPSGLYYMGARYYDPTSGRFVSADPFGHAVSMGLYDYCGGDPINGFDPDGRLSSGLTKFNYEGGLLGHSLSTLSNSLDDFSRSTHSPFLSGVSYYASQMYGTAAGMVTPKSYVDQYNHMVDNTTRVMNSAIDHGDGLLSATGQGLGYAGGYIFGYTPLVEGISGVDIATGTSITTADRLGRGLGGGSQLLGTGLGLESSFMRNGVRSFRLAPSRSLNLGAAKAGDHIALGLRTGLRDFANERGAIHLLEDPAWKETLQTAIKNPDTRFSFKLDLLSGGQSAAERVNASLKAVQEGWGGATDLELHYLNESGRLGDVNFFLEGKSVQNPF